jgi:hemerythrin-like domain-containing protein
MSATSLVQNATNAVMKVLAPQPVNAVGADLLDTLGMEHDEVKSMLSTLSSATSAAQRRSLVEKIAKALVPHSVAEGKVLYSALANVRDADAKVDAQEGFVEHDLVARTLAKLRGIRNATSPEHKATAKVLRELLEHHIREEETNVWRDARKHFSDEQRQKLNTSYLAAKKRIKA